MEILTEIGTIVERNGNVIKIAIPRKSECEHCDSLLCNKSNQGNVIIEIENIEQFQIGDKVEVQILGKQLVSIAVFLYLIPLFLIIFSLTICFDFTSMDALSSTIVAFSLVGFYYLTIRKLNILKTKPKIKRIEQK